MGKRIAKNKELFMIYADKIGLTVLEFTSMREYAKVLCQACGETYLTTPSEIVRKDFIQCNPCSYVGRQDNRIERGKLRFLQVLDSIQATLLEYDTSHTPALVKCRVGHIVLVTPANFIGEYAGVNICTKCPSVYSPYDRVYLVVKEQWAKIGIAARHRRLKDHEYRGWKIYKVWENLPPNEPQRVEASMKLLFKEWDFPNIDKSQMPQGGHTETFPAQYVSDIAEIIEDII
jgi:hypothetical protein